MNISILKGKLNRTQMAKFAGVEFQDLDKSLDRLANMGWLNYEKSKGFYRFSLYSKPVTIRELQLTKQKYAGH